MAKFLDKTGLDTFWAKIKSTFQTLGNLVTSWGSTPSDTKYPSEKLVKTSLDAKAPNAVTTEAAIATGDKLLFSDASDSSKTKRMSIGFDTGVTNTMLRKDGTFAKALYADEGWGGTFGKALAPMDTYLLQQRNCFFGAKPSAIKVEYSTDGGSTWIDYGITDEQKQNLFSQYAGTSVACGKRTHILPTYTGSIVGTKDLSNDNVANQRLRITICCRSLATEGTTAKTDKWLYGTIRRVGIYMSTNSAAKGPRHCVFTAKKREDFNAGNDTWTNFGDYAISGDSGWNSIPCSNKASSNGITFGDSFNGQYAVFRFEVWSEGVNDSPDPSQTGNMAVEKIVAFTELCWQNSSSNPFLANYGMPCTVNASTGNASFPKGITSGVAIPVSSGGTGKTTAKAAEYNLTTGKSEISDTTSGDDRVVFELASPSESNGVTRGFRKLSTIWTWIKGLLSSESGVNISGSSASCTGNAATATAAQSGSALETAINGKVDKVTGKGLSTNDYTTTEKNKLAGIAAGAEVNVQSDWNQTTTTADDYIKNKPTIPSGSQLVYDCGTGSTSTTDFDNALAAFNAGKWVIINKDSKVYYCVGSYSGPGLRFKQLANEASLMKVNTLNWTKGSAPTAGTQLEASLSGHTHSQYLTASDITGKMETNGSNATSAAGGNIIRAMGDWTSVDEDNEAVPAANITSGGTTQGRYTFAKIWNWITSHTQTHILKTSSDVYWGVGADSNHFIDLDYDSRTSSPKMGIWVRWGSGSNAKFMAECDTSGNCTFNGTSERARYAYHVYYIGGGSANWIKIGRVYSLASSSSGGGALTAIISSGFNTSSGDLSAQIIRVSIRSKGTSTNGVYIVGDNVTLGLKSAVGDGDARFAVHTVTARTTSVNGVYDIYVEQRGYQHVDVLLLHNDDVEMTYNSNTTKAISDTTNMTIFSPTLPYAGSAVSATSATSATELRIPYGSGSAYLQIGVSGNYLALGTNMTDGVMVSYAGEASTAAVAGRLAVANAAGTGVTSYYMRAIEHTTGGTTYIALTKNDGTSNVRVKSAENADGCDGWKFKVGSLGTATDTIYFIAGS